MAEHYQPQQLQIHPHHQQPPAASTQKLRDNFSERGPSTPQVLTVVTLVPLGGLLLPLAGLTFAGTLIGLAITAPLFVLFSPVLVPATLTIGLAVAGFLTSGAFGITGLASFSWMLRSMRELLPEQAEQAKRKMQDTAGHLGQRTRDVGHAIEAAREATSTQKLRDNFSERGPSTAQVLTVVTLVPLGGLLLLAGLTFAGTLIGLTITAPLFVLFSPVLVPVTLTIGLAVAGFLTSGAFGITGLASFSWMLRSMRELLPEQAEQAKRKTQDTAGHLGQRTRDVGYAIHDKAHGP